MVFFAVLGSPPRMRGKVVNCIELFSHFGITPAYAGKRRQKRGLKSQYGDHPRVCGEKINVYTREMEELGSPPRMRGKVDVSFCVFFVRRITPAYAGKSSASVHPCGSCMGSPPRMRGKVFVVAFYFVCNRITPAYAGKSSCPLFILRLNRDHPRVCGEKRRCHQTRLQHTGITPAYAGKSHTAK